MHAVALLAMAGSVSAQPAILDLGVLPGANYTVAAGISADGSVVAGVSMDAFSPLDSPRAFRWTLGTGMVNLGELPGFSASWARGVSADGAVVIGIAEPARTRRAFRWTAAGGMQDLSVLAPVATYSDPFAASADGSVVVGQSGLAFRWMQGTGMQALGHIVCCAGNAAFGVSADGSVIVGMEADRAFRWTLGDGMIDLGTLPGMSGAGARAVSADGRIVAGDAGSAPPLNAAVFRWTASPSGTGTMENLGHLSGATSWYTSCISADGGTIGGAASPAGGVGPNRAWIWTRRTGFVELAPFLSSRGVDVSGWALQEVSGLSADGSFLCGTGQHNGQTRAFIARVPCYANCDDSSMVPALNIQDFGCFLNRFAAGDTFANCDHSTTPPVLNVQDFSCFLNAFASGCP